jgi:hypothetical protein
MRQIFSKQTDSRGNKDWRKPWLGKRRSTSFDSSCQNHGGCSYCKRNRTHKNRKRELEAQEQLEDFENGLT